MASRARTLTGVVVSDAMQKSVVVMTARMAKHPRYHKLMRLTKKYMAHDEADECRVGDVVRIAECRPLSKRKYFEVDSILRREKEL